jgi:hypothetical protein
VKSTFRGPNRYHFWALSQAASGADSQKEAQHNASTPRSFKNIVVP